MNIIIGGMMHETNTFNTVPTTLDDFQPLYGQQLYDYDFWRRLSIGGIVHKLAAEGATAVPTVYARANTAGIVEYEAYQEIKRSLLDRIRDAAGIADGICFALHGSMYVDGEEDPEGDLMAAIRAVVGPDMPIVCPLDMHATVTERLIANVNAFTVYRTAPHIDMFQTGEKAAALLLRIIREKLDTVTVSVGVPIIISGEQTETAVSPMKDLMALVFGTDAMPFVLNADYVLGFPWADTPHHCVRALVSGEARNTEKLKTLAGSLAVSFWEKRFAFGYSTEAYPLDMALDIALEESVSPVVLSDAGDNPTAGASSDLTLVLNRLLERKAAGALVAVIADGIAYEACVAAGLGAEVELALGKLETAPDAHPLRVRATVVRLKTGLKDKKINWWTSNAAVVAIDGVIVIVAEQRMAVYDPGFLYELGLHPSDYRLIVVKSGYQSPQYQAIAARSILALTPGHTNLEIATIDYRKAPRPIFPLDRDFAWSPEA